MEQEEAPGWLAHIPTSARAFDETEKAALIKLYAACGGASWHRNGRWLIHPEPSTWHGVCAYDCFRWD